MFKSYDELVEEFANRVFTMSERLRNIYLQDIVGNDVKSEEQFIKFLKIDTRYEQYKSKFEIHILYCIMTDKINFLQSQYESEVNSNFELIKAQSNLISQLNKNIGALQEYITTMSKIITDSNILNRLEELEKEFTKMN